MERTGLSIQSNHLLHYSRRTTVSDIKEFEQAWAIEQMIALNSTDARGYRLARIFSNKQDPILLSPMV